jgi:hypothetical protein
MMHVSDEDDMVKFPSPLRPPPFHVNVEKELDAVGPSQVEQSPVSAATATRILVSSDFANKYLLWYFVIVPIISDRDQKWPS